MRLRVLFPSVFTPREAVCFCIFDSRLIRGEYRFRLFGRLYSRALLGFELARFEQIQRQEDCGCNEETERKGAHPSGNTQQVIQRCPEMDVSKHYSQTYAQDRSFAVAAGHFQAFVALHKNAEDGNRITDECGIQKQAVLPGGVRQKVAGHRLRIQKKKQCAEHCAEHTVSEMCALLLQEFVQIG